MKNAWKEVLATKQYRSGEYVHNPKHITALWDFWKDYGMRLHPLLQLTDPYIFTAIE
jgi:hypothetical protein